MQSAGSGEARDAGAGRAITNGSFVKLCRGSSRRVGEGGVIVNLLILPFLGCLLHRGCKLAEIKGIKLIIMIILYSHSDHLII